MSTRRERRAQARSKDTETEIPLTQPSRAIPRHKTLLDLANERQLLHSSSRTAPSITTTTINEDGTLSTPFPLASPNPPDPPPPTPYLDIALYTTTLTLLHFTLTVLVHHQYAHTPPSLPSLFYTSTIASPAPALLLLLVSMLHPRSSHVATQLFFAALSVGAGTWLVYASNEDPYMAVMKKAPPLGTLWVWAVVEMRWEWAVGCLGVVGGWGWWQGYGIY